MTRRAGTQPNRRRPVTVTMSEKMVEHLGDKLMAACGFDIIRFSQPRRTMQTPGISDRLFISPTRTLAVFWEAKREGGKQSYAQQEFQRLVESVGWSYVCGTTDVLESWLHAHGVIA